MWNENSQVYQLDFGGRVTQESAKNFQIEFRGKQVSAFPFAADTSGPSQSN
jgi:tubby-related protein 4